MTKDIIQIVEKANSLNTDYRGKAKHICCLSCRMGCIDLEFSLNNGVCEHYSHRLSLDEINKEIRWQNIDVKRICKENNLKYGIMKDMLRNRIAISYKYYLILEMRIMEKREYDIYVERFSDGE